MKQLPTDATDKEAEMWLAVTEDDLTDDVTAGEDDGRRLVHDAVARRLERIGQISLHADGGCDANPAVVLAPDWRRDKLHDVVFVQRATSRHIPRLASLPLRQVDEAFH